jgi:hypothetical protein
MVYKAEKHDIRQHKQTNRSDMKFKNICSFNSTQTEPALSKSFLSDQNLKNGHEAVSSCLKMCSKFVHGPLGCCVFTTKRLYVFVMDSFPSITIRIRIKIQRCGSSSPPNIQLMTNVLVQTCITTIYMPDAFKYKLVSIYDSSRQRKYTHHL